MAPASTVCVDDRTELIGFGSPAVDVSAKNVLRSPLIHVPASVVGVAVAFSVLTPVNVPSVAGALFGTRTTSSKSKGVVKFLLLFGARRNPNGLKFAFVLVKVMPFEPHPDPADCEPVVVPQKPCSVIAVDIVPARVGEAVRLSVSAPSAAVLATTESDFDLDMVKFASIG